MVLPESCLISAAWLMWGKLSANFTDVSIHLINDFAFSLCMCIINYTDIYTKKKNLIVYYYYFFNTMEELGSACSSHKVSVCCIDYYPHEWVKAGRGALSWGC